MAALALFSGSAVMAQNTVAEASDAVYQDFGGKDGLRKVVDDFVKIIIIDPRIKLAFKDADLERLAAMLNEQFCQLTGGPCKYSGANMRAAHEDMNITNAQFNALAEDLQEAMYKNNIPSRAQNKLLAKLAPMQRDVVTK
jgi:hemoglobin